MKFQLNKNIMIIGIPKEIKEQEHRVALLPSGTYQLAKHHQVLVETGAGVDIGMSDQDYENAGAEIVPRHEDIFARADLVAKVKEPLPSEYPLLREGQVLFTYLHLAANRDLTQALLDSKVTGIAYESVEVNRRLPLLEPMSEIAGRMSVIVGGYYLAKHCGGKGVLLGGVPLLRGKYARSLRPDRYPGADERDFPVSGNHGGSRPRRGSQTTSRASGRHQCLERAPDQ